MTFQKALRNKTANSVNVVKSEKTKPGIQPDLINVHRSTLTRLLQKKTIYKFARRRLANGTILL